jgi:hypothetical protein
MSMNATTLDGEPPISPKELADLGVAHVAYIKSVVIEGVSGFAIYAADGTALGLLRDRHAALNAVRELELDPVSVH